FLARRLQTPRASPGGFAGRNVAASNASGRRKSPPETALGARFACPFFWKTAGIAADHGSPARRTLAPADEMSSGRRLVDMSSFLISPEDKFPSPVPTDADACCPCTPYRTGRESRRLCDTVAFAVAQLANNLLTSAA